MNPDISSDHVIKAVDAYLAKIKVMEKDFIYSYSDPHCSYCQNMTLNLSIFIMRSFVVHLMYILLKSNEILYFRIL